MKNQINITANFVSSKSVENQSIFHCADKTKIKISGIENQEQKRHKEYGYRLKFVKGRKTEVSESGEGHR